MTELELQETILFNLNSRYQNVAMFWTNPQAGYFDTKRNTFRRHTSKFYFKGISDILGVYAGKIVAIEIKLPKELKWWLNNKDKQNLMNDKYLRFYRQDQFIRRIIELGGIAGFASSLDEAINILENYE